METEKDEGMGRKDSRARRFENRIGFVDTLLQIVRVVMLFVRAKRSSLSLGARRWNTLRFLRSDLCPLTNRSLKIRNMHKRSLKRITQE